ncbi:MAG: hypothetical protein JNG86_08695, partial [Verrucomicrobiaceae bacterium]|nr:hypothetical protein [Verrucomicrobiaceae bacterium]
MRRAALAALFCLALVPAASGATFTAFFNNGSGSGGDDNASAYGWQAAIGTSGAVDATLALPHSTGVSQGTTSPPVPIISGASTSSGFLFALPDAVPGAMLLHTTSLNAVTTLENDPQTRWHSTGPTSLSGLTFGKISRLSVFTRPATTSGIVMRFALRVNGVWHVSAASFSQTDAAAWEQRVLCPSLTLWHPAIFTSGT